MSDWRNPYIELVATLPDELLACPRNVLADEELQRLRAKIAKFSGVVAEPCSGSGGHLITLAQRNPQTLFVGFELRYRRAYRSAFKVHQLGLPNVMFVRYDARRLKELFTPASLDGVYVNFPDPWARMRWQKHRLISPAFLEDVFTLLKPGGIFSHKTDHPDRFRETCATLAALPAAERVAYSEDFLEAGDNPTTALTDFERLWRSQGKNIMYVETRRRMPE